VYDADELLSRGKYELSSDRDPILPRGSSSSLAVLGLNALGVDSVLTRSVDNLLVARLANDPDLRLLERDAIDRVMKEVRLQNSGLTSVQDAARIGALLNAQHVLVGSVSQLGTSNVVSVRIVGTETGRVEGAREVKCNDCGSEDLPRALDLLVQTIVSAR
jgi:TolB-like protein